MSDMNYFIARMLIEDRMREATQQQQARDARRAERPAAARAVRKPQTRRLPRLWRLVHLRQAHG